jgi:hypothetical protein
VILGELSADDVEQAVESVRLKRPANRGAWFHTCVANKAEAAGQDFSTLLAKTTIPKELLNPRQSSELIDDTKAG